MKQRNFVGREFLETTGHILFWGKRKLMQKMLLVKFESFAGKIVHWLGW